VLRSDAEAFFWNEAQNEKRQEGQDRQQGGEVEGRAHGADDCGDIELGHGISIRPARAPGCF